MTALITHQLKSDILRCRFYIAAYVLAALASPAIVQEARSYLGSLIAQPWTFTLGLFQVALGLLLIYAKS